MLKVETRKRKGCSNELLSSTSRTILGHGKKLLGLPPATVARAIYASAKKSRIWEQNKNPSCRKEPLMETDMKEKDVESRNAQNEEVEGLFK
ncbi:hypothetical protein CEXT_460221 [Caerostris extrusa]|uniref:Uncharacterized protein n=1 Tax=Caerostris extrusa TaxID=172846 RepID=A0AAV4WHE7_CAEEX|nr:hypothetical protein CEXT_460221 [Caerostris extrusa]